MVAHIVSSWINGSAAEVNLDEIVAPGLNNIKPPTLLAWILPATDRVVSAVKNKETIGIVTDYNCDGITAHAVIYEA